MSGGVAFRKHGKTAELPIPEAFPMVGVNITDIIGRWGWSPQNALACGGMAGFAA